MLELSGIYWSYHGLWHCHGIQVAMLKYQSMLWLATVIFHIMHAHASTDQVQTSTNKYVLGMYSDSFFMNRLLLEIARVVYAWTSTSWSKVGLTLFTYLPPIGHVRYTPQWLEYKYRIVHPFLRWLPTKLAEWIGKNLQDRLGFPDKAGTGWTPEELNHILSITDCPCCGWCFDYIWLCGMGVSAVQSCDVCKMYPFNLLKKSFHSFNPQVGCTLIDFKTISGTY